MASFSIENAAIEIKEFELALRDKYKELDLQFTGLKRILIDVKRTKLDPEISVPLIKALKTANETCGDCEQVLKQMKDTLLESQKYVENVLEADVKIRSLVGRKWDSGIASMGSSPGSALITDVDLSGPKEENNTHEATQQQPVNTTTTESDSDEDNTRVDVLHVTEGQQASPASPKIQNNSTDSTCDDPLNNLSSTSITSSQTEQETSNDMNECVPLFPPSFESLQIDITCAGGCQENQQPRESAPFEAYLEDEKDFLETQAAKTQTKRNEKKDASEC